MPDISRRAVVRTAAAGLVFAPLANAGAALAAQTNPYSRSRFTPLIGRSFVLGETGTSLTLSRVADLAGAPAGDPNRYCLTFRTTGTGPEQGSYTLQRPRFAATPLFLVPADASRRTFYAIVSRTF